MNAQTSSGTIPQPATISTLCLTWSDAQIRADQAFRQLARVGEETEGAAGAADHLAQAIAVRRDGDGQGGFDRADRVLAFVGDLELLVDATRTPLNS